MNKKKIINVIELFLQICALLMLLFGTFAEYYRDAHYENYKYVPAQTIKNCFQTKFEENPLGSIIIVALMLSNIIMCIVSACNKSNKKDSVLHSALPIVNFVYLWLYILVYNYSKVDTKATIYPIFYLLFIIMFLIILLGFIKSSNITVLNETSHSYKTQDCIESSNADELKKFKGLLDSGIITQEEFDEKKRQLLDL